MFYVARLAGVDKLGKHAVFPISWMRNSDVQLEKFVQNRINRNQVHIFFWSNEKNGDGEPSKDVQPDFGLPIQKTFPPAVDGCFYGQPVKFFCKYDDAVAYMNGLRTIEPGLYNVRRLTEAPLPELIQNTADQNSEDGNPNNNTQSNLSNIESEPPNSQNDSVASFDQLVVSSSSDSVLDHELNNTNDLPENQDDSVHSSSNVRDEFKPELHFTQRADLAEINNVLNSNNQETVEENEAEVNEAEVDGAETNGAETNAAKVNADKVNAAELIEENGSDSDDDDKVEMVILNGIFPQPVQYSSYGLIKREDDPISGNLAYDDAPQVCICFSRFSFNVKNNWFY